jgi:hypothetical protein
LLDEALEAVEVANTLVPAIESGDEGELTEELPPPLVNKVEATLEIEWECDDGSSEDGRFELLPGVELVI